MKKFLVLILLLSSTVYAEPRLRPMNWATPVIGTRMSNLYKVDKELYRSEQPDEENVNNMQRLGIKEVLNLRDFHSDNDELEKGHFILDRVKMKAGSVTENQIISALRIINNRKGPILVHCWHGSDRTGVTIAAYRIVFENWTKAQALDEMVNGGYGYHASFYPNLVNLIKRLDVVGIRQSVGFVNRSHALAK